MADRKLFAGARVRRLRRTAGLTQAAMADALGVSPSYLNLIERNQRPLTAAVLLRLAQTYDFDARTLAGEEPGGGAEAMRRRLADPLFADLGIDRAEVEEWLAAVPAGAEAFARVFDRLQGGGERAEAPPLADPLAEVRREIERWRNYFADLDAQAEALADELRLAAGDPYGAIAERLRARHSLVIRILPADVMPGLVRRLDLHARQLQLSELLDAPSRVFQAAYELGQIEAKAEIDALVAGGRLTARPAERLFRRHLAGYFAAAVMMPYGRFLRACEAGGYDMLLLRRRFGASFEQVAHRLTTLQRVGARGLPFFLLRLDRAGQSSKAYAGASGSPLVAARGRCPLWGAFRAFDRPGAPVTDLVELEDGARWFTLARSVPPAAATAGVAVEFVLAIGLEASLASPLAAARGIDLRHGPATPIGLGCRDCLRPACPQRAAPPAGRHLLLNDRERGVAPFPLAED